MADVIELLKVAWGPVVEIAILTVAIYYAFMFMRGTRGWPVVVGFLVLLALTFVCSVLNFNVLATLLRTFFAFSAVAVLIIFQPEFRRMLAEIGNAPWFTTAREQRENIEVVIQTVERLSEVRIGALIAMERTINLQEVVESGVPVNCEATPEMLETIFFPNNAIHDGGVILKGDVIAFAACIFPLTQRQDLSKTLGTRHRAAIGLTEETDAVVVVVSEETGAVSYAFKGQLVKGITIEELRSFLTSIFVPRAKKTPIDWIRTRWAERVTPSAPVVTHDESPIETNGSTDVDSTDSLRPEATVTTSSRHAQP